MSIYLFGKDAGLFGLNKTEKDGLELQKVREDWHCVMCKSLIKQGDWAIGDKYDRVCLRCAGKFFNNLVGSLNKTKVYVQGKREEFIGKLKECVKSNMANSLVEEKK